MKKQLNVASIANELKNGSRFFSPQVDDDAAKESPEVKRPGIEVNDYAFEAESTAPSTEQSASQSTSQSANGSTAQSTIESTRQSATQSTSQSTEQSATNHYDESPILGRPKSFYISHQQDKDLDLAVAKLASGEFGPQTQKIDRSSLLRLILEEMNVTSEKTLQRLQQRHIDRQLCRLRSRQLSRPVS